MTRSMRHTVERTILAGLAAVFLLWSLGACAGAKKQPVTETASPQAPAEPTPAPLEVKPAPPKEPTYFIRIVKWPNESLSIIAAWYTGDLDNWKIVVEANPELDPKRLRIGDKVRIPEELLKTREPMPHEFVESLVPKPRPVKKAAPPEKQKPPPSEPDIKLYGPKQ